MILMKKLFYLIVIMSVIPVFAVADDLRFGLSEVNPHSNANTRCADPGYAFEAGYDYTLFNYDYSIFGFDLDVGPEFIYSNYETAYRRYSSEPRSDKRRESSVNLSGIVKPTIKIWRFSLYYMAGVGGDWMQEDGISPSYTLGKGIDFQILDNVSVGVSEKRTERADTGRYKFITGLIKITF